MAFNSLAAKSEAMLENGRTLVAILTQNWLMMDILVFE